MFNFFSFEKNIKDWPKQGVLSPVLDGPGLHYTEEHLSCDWSMGQTLLVLDKQLQILIFSLAHMHSAPVEDRGSQPS